MSYPNYQLTSSPLKTKNTGQCDSIVDLKMVRKVWAISAIHAQTDRLVELHDNLLESYEPGDRIVYLGNYIGYGHDTIATLEELMTFRRLILSLPGVIADDLVYLRGAQEEMLDKIQQLNFAPNAEEVLLWMLGHGMAPTLTAYNIDAHEGIIASKEGAMGLTRWTNKVRHQIRQNAGHECFFSNLKRAAFFNYKNEPCSLFVSSGYNSSLTLRDQGDYFWWSNEEFDTIKDSDIPFKNIIRGFDPQHKGIRINDHAVTIDGSCGFGGSLICACVNLDGKIFELFEC